MDAPGFDEFVNANARALQQSAWLLTGDWAAAEDLVQLTLVRLWQRWDTAEAPVAYARRVLINGYLSGRRRLWRGEVPVAELPEHSIADGLGATDLRESLRSGLAVLPAKQRAAIVLRFFLDLPEAQVAQLLGCSIGNVKSQTSRALDKLRSTPGLRDLLEEVHHG